MTKDDYMLVARTIHETLLAARIRSHRAVIRVLAERLSVEFKRAKPSFNPDKFKAAYELRYGDDE
ncbi:MAG: hypothetical protein MN733_03390 [Nitrososphaera sp.]|nr:hypothetical protein [Nitrososphaera sp.]